MSDFKHSIVLFSGDDGLPIKFNIRNTVEKSPLKAMIEHGGGLCALSDDDDAILLISPGTRVLNVDRQKKLISSRYIFDCVKENYLLDMDDYIIKITEVETSDISEEGDSVELLKNAPTVKETSANCNKDNENKCLEHLDLNEAISENRNDELPDNDNLNGEATNCNAEHAHDYSRLQSKTALSTTENPNFSSTTSDISNYLSPEKPESISAEKSEMVDDSYNNVPNNISAFSEMDEAADNIGIIPETDSNNDASVLSIESNKSDVECSPSVAKGNINDVQPCSPICAVVVSSSQNSQPATSALDGFDNLLLSKLQEKPDAEEDALSQSYTVSSSQDAQVSAKATPENTSVEIFAAPDSASQNSQPNERDLYIKNLEAEVECILQKSSPKSIQDKICLVKYICCVKKLPPAAVLQSLQNL